MSATPHLKITGHSQYMVSRFFRVPLVACFKGKPKENSHFGAGPLKTDPDVSFLRLHRGHARGAV